MTNSSSHLGMDFEYDFVAPPWCVVFEPTMEEFKDALAYIEKIRPEAEKYGICKIKPPEEWQPPFAVDVDKLRFTPRIQRLNELEAHTRIKLNFLDQVAKFWELQGSTLKIPLVDRRALDLYTLKKFVLREGGMDQVNEEKTWMKVATDMGFSVSNKNIPALLKAHYERILYPLDVFQREEQKKAQALKDEIKEEEEDQDSNNDDDEVEEKEYKPPPPPTSVPSGRMGMGRMGGMRTPANADKGGMRRPKRYAEEGPCPSGMVAAAAAGAGSEKGSPVKKEEDSKAANSFSKELARLQFFGAGPKMAGLPNEKSIKEKTRGSKLSFEYDPLAKYMCQNCGKGDAEEQMLLCDGCDDSYHTFCLMPPLTEIPKGDWRCPKCVAAEVSKPMEAFGFEQAQKEYTLQSFGEMADQFKSDYFNMPVHLIPTSLVEKEYWRILENIDEDVMVEYGADLHTMDHGSGFPTLNSKNLSKEDEIYAKSDWNLNRLPIVSNSILRSIDMDISGMKVPWLYVGMCFSTFCWHTEDHWTPSINYLHWGEPKTWYGIPAQFAEKAENVMRESAKELFSGQPDLLHHIVTTMNPNVLQAHGIPVYRCDQYAGEFMITWPRGYHAGFNHGYNLAEAVNFAPPDWLEMGRKCVEHYSTMRRYCVFCHDELVCQMATQAHKLTLQVAAATYKDMLTMVEWEKKMRRQLLEAGVTEAEREAFELLPDDERQCAICKTTCFNSALTSIDNKENEIVCLRHFKSMECDPEKLVLRYRYTLDELATLLANLKSRAECYDLWVDRTKKALEAKGEDREELEDLKGMLEEATERKYPESELLEALQLTVEEAEKCQTVAQQLGNKKQVRTRTRGVLDTKYRLTVEELQLFANQLEMLPAKVSGHEAVAELISQVESFQKDARKLLELEKPDTKDIEKCVEVGVALDVELPELNQLKGKHKQTEWLEEVQDLLQDSQASSFEQLKEALDTGTDLPPHPSVEKALGEISGLLTEVDSWEEKAKLCLSAKPRWAMSDVDKLVREGETVSNGLPSLAHLKDLIRKAKEWWARAESIQSTENFPYLETLEALVAKGRPLPVRLDPLTNLETQVASARAWRERTARVFLKKNSHLNLLDVLCPRFDIGGGAEGRKRKQRSAAPKEEGIIPHPFFSGLTPKDLSDPQNFVRTFKEAEKEEVEAIIKLRETNSADEERQKNGKMRIMIECELCRELFHPSHVPLPKTLPPASAEKGPGSPGGSSNNQNVSSLQKPSSLHEIKFLCPSCLRSRRPRLETILSLLVSLQKLTVRLPEGEALQCLTERAMSWQKRASTALAMEEIAAALNKLQHNNKSSPTAQQSTTSEEPNNKPEGPPEIKLSKKALDTLEELMLEGDMLEVSLDETQHIWRVLQATEPRRSKQYPDLVELEAELESVREEKLKARKKRKMDTEGSDSGSRKRSSGVGGGGGEKGKKRAVTTTTKRRMKKNGEEMEQGGQEDCSANPSCLRPTGKEVHWVQCDGCQLWFHLYCIGLKPEQVSEDTDFICKHCKPNRFKKRKLESKKSDD